MRAFRRPELAGGLGRLFHASAMAVGRGGGGCAASRHGARLRCGCRHRAPAESRPERQHCSRCVTDLGAAGARRGPRFAMTFRQKPNDSKSVFFAWLRQPTWGFLRCLLGVRDGRLLLCVECDGKWAFTKTRPLAIYDDVPYTVCGGRIQLACRAHEANSSVASRMSGRLAECNVLSSLAQSTGLSHCTLVAVSHSITSCRPSALAPWPGAAPALPAFPPTGCVLNLAI